MESVPKFDRGTTGPVAFSLRGNDKKFDNQLNVRLKTGSIMSINIAYQIIALLLYGRSLL
jgi:hypothetical protein